MFVLVKYTEKPMNVIVVSMFSNIDFKSMYMSQSSFDPYNGKTIESAKFIQMSEGDEVSTAVRLRFTDGDYVLLGVTWMVRR
jgi:hypothetical protein